MSRIIAVANAKGGVGKTTTAVNISAALAEAGYRVLAIDLDPQSSLTLSLGMNPLRVPGTICSLLSPGSDFLNAPIIHLQEQWDLIPANEELRALEHELDSDPKKIYTIGAGLHPFRDVYDYIILDCAASMGVLTGAALAAADSVIIPLTPDFLAFQVSAILFRIIRRVQETINPNLQIAGIFLTMYDTRTKHAREILTHIRKTYGASVPFFSAVIYLSVKLKEAPSLGQSVLKYAPQSQAARAYRVVAREIVEGAPKLKRAQDKSKKNGAQNSALLANENGQANQVQGPAAQPVAPPAIAPVATEPAPVTNETPIADSAKQLATVLPIFEIHNDPPIDHHTSELVSVGGENAPVTETTNGEKKAEADSLSATSLDDQAGADKAGQGANGLKGKLVHLVGKVRTAVPMTNGNGATDGVTGLFKKLRERTRQTNGNGLPDVNPIRAEESTASASELIEIETPSAPTNSTIAETPNELETQKEPPTAELETANVDVAAAETVPAQAATPEAAIPPAQAEPPTAETPAQVKMPAVETETPPAELAHPTVGNEIPAAEISNASEGQDAPANELIQIDATTTTLELVTEEPASHIDELDAEGGEANDAETDESISPIVAFETIVVDPTLALEPRDSSQFETTIHEPQAEVVGPPFDNTGNASAAPLAEPPLPGLPAANAQPPHKSTPSEIWSLPYIPPSEREPATLSVVGSDVILDNEPYQEEQEPTIQELLRRVAMLASTIAPTESESQPEEDEPDFEKLTQELFGAEPDAYASGSEQILPPAPPTGAAHFAHPEERVTDAQPDENPIVLYRAAEIARDDVEAWIRRAENSEAPWEALAAWLHVLEVNPLNGYARTRMEEMIRAWLEIAKRDEVDELIKLGNSLVQAGQRAPADETFRRVIELNPRAHRAWLGRALVTSNPLDRLVFVQRGLELAPGDPEVRRALAGARDQLNAEANRLLEEGLHLAHSGRTAQAHLLFKHAVELAPLDDRAWLGCARTADNLPSKLSYLKQCLQINPANTEAQDLYRILTNFMGTGKRERWAITPNDPRVIYFALGLLMLLAALVAIPLFIIH